MGPSVQIPQDVLECIIDELHSDIDTLKTCAVISHSFLAPTRRHLFHSIRLDTPLLSHRLCNLFTTRPEIALYVRKLFLLTGDSLHRQSWLASDKSLPTILRMVDHLQMFTMSQLTQLIYWDKFSTEVASALADRFRSPMLTVVKIWQCRRLPVSLINNFLYVKELSLILTSFYDDSEGTPVSVLRLPRLHSLEILPAARNDQPVAIFPQMENLQLLFIRACDWYTLSVTQEVIRSCATSIRSVMWCYMWMKEESTFKKWFGHSVLKP